MKARRSMGWSTWGLARRTRVGRRLAKGAAGKQNQQREVELQAALRRKTGGFVRKVQP